MTKDKLQIQSNGVAERTLISIARRPTSGVSNATVPRPVHVQSYYYTTYVASVYDVDVAASSLLLLAEDAAGTIVRLLVGLALVLELGKGVASAGCTEPVAALAGPTLEVKVGKVLEFSSLGDVLLVVGIGLGGILAANGRVLTGGQTRGHVRVGTNGSLRKL